MPTRICCRYCRVEFARIALADRSAAIVCLDCDVMTIERAPARSRHKRAAEQAASRVRRKHR